MTRRVSIIAKRPAENDPEKALVLTISFAQLCFAAWRFSGEGSYT
jgi:hypothetical protein